MAKDSDTKDIILIIKITIAAAVLYVILEILIFILANWVAIVLIIGLCGVGYYLYKKNRKEQQERDERLKLIQRETVRDAERTGINSNEDEKYKDLLLSQIVESINSFSPLKDWPDEASYQLELLGYLKRDYPDIQYELQTGSSRPDLVIRNIAIELKGPTDNQALDTLTTKCLKYSNYYDHLIIVLFNPTFSDRHFNEIRQGIDRYFPHVVIIKK